VIRLRKTGEVSSISFDEVNEANHAFYVALLYVDEAEKDFIGLFDETTLIKNNSERSNKHDFSRDIS